MLGGSRECFSGGSSSSTAPSPASCSVSFVNEVQTQTGYDVPCWGSSGPTSTAHCEPPLRARLSPVVEAFSAVDLEDGSDDVGCQGPELLDTVRSPATSVYSEARDSHARSPWRSSLKKHGEWHGDPARAEAHLTRESRRLPGFMVTLPAGSGCSDLPSSSSFIDVERAASSASRHAVPCRRCAQLESELILLRAKFAEELAHERADWQQRLQLCKESMTNAVAAASEAAVESHVHQEALQLHQVRRELQSVEMAVSIEEASCKEAQRDLHAETALAEGGVRWQAESLELCSQLAESEQRRDDAIKRAEKARKQAAEVERQRRELVKQTGTQELQRLRSELEKITKEREESVKKLKKLHPRVEAAQEEEARLQQALEEQKQTASLHLQTAKHESAEAGKVREHAKSLRRSLQGQLDALGTELAEARFERQEAAQELSKEQRQRLDESRKHRAVLADRQNIRAEVEELRSRLHAAESSLQMQAHQDGLANRHSASMQGGMGNRDLLFARALGPGRRPASSSRSPGRRRTPPRAPPGWNSATSTSPHERVNSREASRGRTPQRLTSRSPNSVPGSAHSTPRSGRGEDSGQTSETGREELSSGACSSTTTTAMEGSTAAPPRTVAFSGAGERLFAMIERAKERADQRRLLRGAAEEVRSRAHALEELLAKEAMVDGVTVEA